VVTGAISSVWPSGAALATNCAPMLPDAPALLSTTTGLPSASPSFCDSRRATASTAPPAA
jgi:hypothetical protein